MCKCICKPLRSGSNKKCQQCRPKRKGLWNRVRQTHRERKQRAARGRKVGEALAAIEQQIIETRAEEIT